MDFTTLLVLGALWLVFNVLTKGKGTGQPPGRRPQPRTPPWEPSPPAERSPPPAAAGSTDPTQREGSRLETLLRDLNRSLEEAARAASDVDERDEPARASSGVDVDDEMASLEGTGRSSASSPEDRPEAVSLEREVRRPARARVDQDDQAGQVVARRIAAAEARGGALTAADHAAFDRRIRQEPADHTAVAAPRRYTPQQLRDAMVWREILGPPVSER